MSDRRCGRTRRVSGTLTRADAQVRSRVAQVQAGGSDRRSIDEGGPYIATRFNGPTDAFDQFVQNANFNRGQSRLMEDQWAKESGQGGLSAERSCQVLAGSPKLLR
ncbi:DNA/RNA non-specific endonuclease [Sphingomonas glacialis]|uniref:DNA/RNA non-specific endonuclease n=1 Tax=Sphingomonas glacialis TaxID=658225 RepID=UPI003D688AB5